jgi:hypothetical protein
VPRPVTAFAAPQRYGGFSPSLLLAGSSPSLGSTCLRQSASGLADPESAKPGVRKSPPGGHEPLRQHERGADEGSWLCPLFQSIATYGGLRMVRLTSCSKRGFIIRNWRGMASRTAKSVSALGWGKTGAARFG